MNTRFQRAALIVQGIRHNINIYLPSECSPIQYQDSFKFGRFWGSLSLLSNPISTIMDNGTVLIIRATGTQGTAVTRHLLQRGLKVHALVRNLTEERALKLKSLGATLFKGELDDTDAISSAIAGCTGLFFTLMPSFTDDSEIQQAKRILQTSKSAGVEHIIYTSSIAVGNHRESPHWDPTNLAAPAIEGKYDTEELICRTGFPKWTFIRPGYFMTNFLLPSAPFMFPGLGEKTEFVTSLRSHTVLPLVDPNDIGAFAAAAFLDPGKFDQQEIRLAGDLRTVQQVIQTLSEVSGRSIKAIYRSSEETEELAKTDPLIAGQLLSLDMARDVDLKQLKKWGVPLGTFSEFLKREHKTVAQTFKLGD
jgi:uncharacterized protein YbjT (DUF2867 family)